MVDAVDTAHGRTAQVEEGDDDEGGSPRVRDTWLLHRPQLLQLLIAYLVLTGIWVGLGKLLTGPLEDGAIVEADVRVADDLAANRTPRMDDFTEIGTLLADTFVKIVVTAIIALVMLAVWKRWRDPLMMIVPLVLEASAFITITVLVGRPRPEVERMEGSPVDSSFPSGHTAAAACYTALAIVIAWRTRHRWLPIVAAVVLLAIPVIVGYSRMYRGMHFLSDVVAGFVLGIVSVVVSWVILRHADEGPFRLRRADHR
ncbi:MAG: phosphatase PAP2 family protein [Actinomycetota bacterium]|nr:phosphatase PAP2 family protein [Acidimicrobiia bacterium]MDQ3469587.1 phosphatase PAP2 family protein [Actinomycetota bacterium]